MTVNAKENLQSLNKTQIKILNNYISKINDPYTNTECNGYVLVAKNDSGYSYEPYLKCGASSTVGNSSTDGLNAYYSFDDHQESTDNLYNTVVPDDADIT